MTQIIEGLCSICGEHKPLTEEHMPPKGGYKGALRMSVKEGDAAFEAKPGKLFQNGFYEYTTCSSCNNIAGTLYGREYVKWTKWGINALKAAAQEPSKAWPHYVGHPLRIAKQVVATLLALSRGTLGEERPDLRTFVLDQHAILKPENARLSLFFCPALRGRSSGAPLSARYLDGPEHRFVEYALLPFGYVLTLSGTPYESRLYDISWFAGCLYEAKCTFVLDGLRFLPTFTAFPGDYRNAYEIRRDQVADLLRKQGNSNAEQIAEQMMANGHAKDFLESHAEDWLI